VKADVVIHRDFSIASVDPRIFGVHLGTAGGPDHRALVDRRHPAADETGVRTDILDLVRAYRLPCAIVGDGPSGEPSSGTPILVDTVLDWCRRSGAEPMVSLAAASAATRSPLDRIDSLPDVRMWRLDPFDGDADDASLMAVAERLRASDTAATVTLAARDLTGAPTLDRLLRLGPAIDLISVPRSSPSALTIGEDIDSALSLLDRGRITDRHRRSIGLQIDAWDCAPGQAPARTALDRAITVNALLRRADRVKVAFAGGVVAGIARQFDDRIGMGPRPGLYDAVLAGSIYGRGIALMPASRRRDDDGLPSLDVAAVLDPETASVTLFLANPGDDTVASAELHGFSSHVVAELRLASPRPPMPGIRPPAPVFDGQRLDWRIPAGGYGLVKLSPRPS
jgi:hypothetical protein